MFVRYASKALFATAAVAATLVFVVAPASAQTFTRAVSYADLDLTSDAGMTALQRRVRGAARYVCGPIAGGGYAEQSEVFNCRTTAIENASRAIVTVVAAIESGDKLALRSGTIMVGRN